MEKFNQMSYQQKRRNHFEVEFPNNNNFKDWWIKSINKPKYFGNGVWGDIEIEFIDQVGYSSSEVLYNAFINVDDTMVGNFKIHQLDDNSKRIETWYVIIDNFTIDFGSFRRFDKNGQIVKMIVKTKNCFLETIK